MKVVGDRRKLIPREAIRQRRLDTRSVEQHRRLDRIWVVGDEPLPQRGSQAVSRYVDLAFVISRPLVQCGLVGFVLSLTDGKMGLGGTFGTGSWMATCDVRIFYDISPALAVRIGEAI